MSNSQDSIITNFQAIPKAELHVHLEGTIAPHTLLKLARKNKIPMADRFWDNQGRYLWKNFQEFLMVYDKISSFLKTPDDYALITYDYLISLHQQGCFYVELSFSPDHAKQSGMSYISALEGVCRGIDQAQNETGIVARIITIFVRQWGVELADQTLSEVLNTMHPWVVGIGLGGDEIRFPGSLFASVFHRASEAGLGCTAHTGEFCGPESIRETIQTLPITRLGHGVRCIEDPSLVQLIKDQHITLECCPTSNVALGVFPDYDHHPLSALIGKGVAVTLNTDDPPHFGTSMVQEYKVAHQKMGLSTNQLVECTARAIQSSFADSKTKQKLEERVKLQPK